MVDFRVSGTASLDPDRIIEDVDMIIEKLDAMKDKIDELDVAIDNISGKSIDVGVNIDGEDKLVFLRDLIDDLDSRIYVVSLIVDVHDQDKLDELKLEVDQVSAARHTVGIDVDLKGAVQATTELEALDRELNNKESDFKKAKNSADGFKFSLLSLLPLFTAIIPIVAAAGGGLMALAGVFGVMLPGLVGIALAAKPAFTAIQKLSGSLDQNTKNAIANAKSYDQIYNALNKNSAAFRSMSGDMQGLTVGWFQLQNAYSAFQRAVDPTVLPMLEQGLELLRTLLSGLPAIVNPAASALQGLILNFENRLHDPVFQSFFNDMKRNIGTFVTDWGQGVLNILEGIAALLHAFMPLSIDISGGFLKMTQSFDQWAQSVGKSKGFQEFIDYVHKNGPVVLDVIKQLGLLLAHLGGALSGMGQGSLGIIDHLLQSLNHLVDTNPGLFKVAANLLLIGISASKFLPMIGPLLAFLATPAGAIVGVIIGLGAAFLYAYTHSKEFHDWVQKNLMPMFHDLVQKAQEFVNFFKSMWPDIQAIWQKYGKNIENIVMDFVNAIKGLFEGLMKIIEGIFQVLDGILTGKWSKIWDGLLKIVEGAWKVIYSVFDNAAKIIIQLLEMLGKTIWGLVVDAWNNVTSVFNQAQDRIAGIVRNLVNSVVATVEQWGRDILNAITTSWNAVNAFFGGVPGRILSAIGNIASLLWNAGVQLIQGFINGIENMFGSVRNVLGTLTSLLTSWKGPPERDRTLLKSSGQLVIQGFMDGLESKYDDVHSSLEGFTKSIGSKFGQQYTTDISTKISAAIQDANYAVGSYNQGGRLPNANSTQVTFSPGAIVIHNPTAEPAGVTLTRTLQGAAHFGTIQAPVGYTTRT